MTADRTAPPDTPSGTGDESLLALAVREAPEGIAILSEEGHVRFANPAFHRLTQRTAHDEVRGQRADYLAAVGVAGRRLEDLVPAEGTLWEGDLRVVDKPGAAVELVATLRRMAVPDGGHAILLVARDVTRLRLLERSLADAQRMEAVGQLAGGVAHDFNNILSVITTLSDLLLRMRSTDDPDREDLEEIFRAARRGSEITRQLSAFSRTGPGEPQELDLNASIRNNEKMFRRLLSEDIELVWELGDDVPPVYADPLQIDQMILNLSLNACDAMPSGGTLRIATRREQLAEPREVSGSQLPAGTYALMEVLDSGEGMDEATRRRVFEPFFTTQGWGRRSGLGLSVAYGSVRGAGGSIDVESRVGHGTRFRIFLPAHVASPPEMGDALPRGEETILVVEDHSELRKGLRRFLAELGYRVIDAAGGAEAIALIEEGGLRPHLVATDVVMPGLGGTQLEAGMGELGLSVPVLYFSGHTDHPEVHRLRRAGVRVLPKPVDMERMAHEVRTILDRSFDTST